jgi:hypothetical protein
VFAEALERRGQRKWRRDLLEAKPTLNVAEAAADLQRGGREYNGIEFVPELGELGANSQRRPTESPYI